MISNSGNKIFSFYNDAKKLIKGELVIPRFVSLWLTTSCDLKCLYCYFDQENTKHIFANVKDVLKFINEIHEAGIEAIEFSGGGEPTLHPDCFDIAKYAKDIGLKVGMLTNGFRFDYKKAVENFDYIRIGVDAHSAPLYSVMKGSKPERFNKLTDNIEELLFWRNKNKRPTIGIKFMINSINYRYISDMISLAQNLGIDYAHFKSTHNDRFSLHNVLSDLELSILQREFEEKKNGTFPIYGSLQKVDAVVKCFMSPIHTVITPEGDLLVCCYFTDKEHIVGNVFKDEFLTVWNSAQHKEIIKSISVKECNQQDCRWSVYNNEMNGILESGKYDLSFI